MNAQDRQQYEQLLAHVEQQLAEHAAKLQAEAALAHREAELTRRLVTGIQQCRSLNRRAFYQLRKEHQLPKQK